SFASFQPPELTFHLRGPSDSYREPPRSLRRRVASIMERPLFPWPPSLTESPTLTDISDFGYPDETDRYQNTTAQPIAASAGPMSYDADISMLQDSVNLPSSQVASYQPAMAGNNASFLQNPVGQYPYPEPSNYQQNAWVNQQQPQLSNVAFQSVAQLGTQNPGSVNYQINTLVNQQHPELFGGVFESVVQMGMQNHVDELTDGIVGPVNDDVIEPRYVTQNRQAHGAPYT
ncbi:hypothetical protein AtubIFM57258_001272, partial [Aspergillus tubingensis]